MNTPQLGKAKVKYYDDPTSGASAAYTDDSQFFIYLRKSNAKKVLKYITNDIKEAFEHYNAIQVWRNGLKTLEIRDARYTRDLEVARRKGTVQRPESEKGKRSNIRFNVKRIEQVNNAPESLVTKFKHKVSQIPSEDLPVKISYSMLVQIVLANFLDINADEVKPFIREGYKRLCKERLLSGSPTSSGYSMDTEKKIKLVRKEIEVDDLL